MVEERVQKLISQAGICSRRKAEQLIQEGKVQVNDKIITIGDKADINKDEIFVDGKPIEKEKPTYYMLNKPKDFITTNDDLFNRKKVIDLLPPNPRVFPVGRLDRDATGILILTNDGDFANKIMHPRYEIKKTYLVKLKDKPFEKKHIVALKKGIRIDKKIVRSEAKIINDFVVEITLHVGIHKIVKRLFKTLGYYVRSLQRIKIGKLKLDIPMGTYRNLKEVDKQLIFKK